MINARYSRNVKKKWDDTSADHWQGEIDSPWRPSLQDIEHYKRALKTVFPLKNILILGATPELRDLAAQLGKKVWVIDYSPNMYYEMGKLLKVAKPEQEKLVVSDWCQCRGLKKNFFDIVLGDLVLRLISPARQKIFFQKIAGLLKPQGFFITRIHFVNESLKNSSAARIINSTLGLSRSFSEEEQRYISHLLVSRLLDKNSHFFSRHKIRKKAIYDIKKYLENNPEINLSQKEILEKALYSFGKNGIPLSSPFCGDKNKIKRMWEEFFIYRKKLISKDYNDAEYFPLCILRLRRKK